MAKPTITFDPITNLSNTVDGISQRIFNGENLSSKQLQQLHNAGQDLTNALTPTPHFRASFGVNRRTDQIMTWRVPNGSSVQMYINPQSFVVRDSKQISETRTKGGFVVQYWGENLTQISITGTTGSSGIRGINVLRDIYRSEMRGFDLIAAQTIADLDEVRSGLSINENTLDVALENTANKINERNFLLRPSLASLAASVLLFYQGVQYKGYFKDFAVTENTTNLGLFDYTMTFMATETRGQRKNFMAWHKEPLADDLAGQLINGVGNAVRGFFGLTPQAPEAFHPETAPLSFGGNAVAATLGLTEPLNQERSIFI